MKLSKKSEKGIIDSYIGKSVNLKGILNFKGSLKIDGKFEGEITADDTLIVGESGNVKAEIKGETVINKGKILGNIEATKKISFYSQSLLSGNIHTPLLYVEEGTEFYGNCKMPKTEQRQPISTEIARRPRLIRSPLFILITLILISISVYSIFSFSNLFPKKEKKFEKQKAVSSEIVKITGSVEVGYRLIKENRLQEAADEFKKVIEARPDNISALMGMATIYSKMGQESQTQILLNEVIRLNPQYLEAHYILALLYEKRGLINKSLFHYQKVVEIDPKRYDIFDKIGDIYKNTGLLDESITAYEQVIRLKPDETKALSSLVELYLKQNLTEKAIPILEKLIELEPDKNDNLMVLGDLYIKNNMKEKGLGLYQKIIEKDPKNIKVLFEMGNLFFEQGKYQKAISALKNLLDHEPDHAPSLNRLAWIYTIQEKNLDEGIRLSEKSLQLKPNTAGYLDTLAELYYKKKQYQKAIEIINQAIKLAPDRRYFYGQLKKFKNSLNK